MIHVVSLSGGISSAVMAERVVQRHGADSIRLWFADTLWEDEDLYAFLDWLESYLNVPIVRYVDGRKPLEVAEQEHIIPNQKIAPCTYRLKIEPFRAYLASLRPEPITVYIGYNWTEPHRMKPTRANYASIGVECVFPLVEWNPIETRTPERIAVAWGVPLPRMYRLGYSHHNCGGRCVKQGIGDWRRTLIHFPDRFEEVATWESRMREDERFAGYAIVRDQSGGTVTPYPLTDLAADQEIDSPNFLSLADDTSLCLCNAGDIGAGGVYS